MSHTLAQKYLIELLIWNASNVQKTPHLSLTGGILEDPTWKSCRSKLSTSLPEGSESSDAALSDCENRTGTENWKHGTWQLVQQFKLKFCRYREVISHPFPPMAIASLRAVCQRCCTPLLEICIESDGVEKVAVEKLETDSNKNHAKRQRSIEVLHLFRWSTHTVFHHLLCLSFLPRPRYNLWSSVLEEVDLWGYPVL